MLYFTENDAAIITSGVAITQNSAFMRLDR
jgi:hypothetical protein